MCGVFFCRFLFFIFFYFFSIFRLCFLLKSELSLAGGGTGAAPGFAHFPSNIWRLVPWFYHVLRSLKWRLKALVLYIQHN